MIHTNSPRVRQARKTQSAADPQSQHNSNCTVCVRSGNCQLQKLSNDLNYPLPALCGAARALQCWT